MLRVLKSFLYFWKLIVCLKWQTEYMSHFTMGLPHEPGSCAINCPSTDKGPVLNVVKFELAEIPVLNQNDGTPCPHQYIVIPFPALLDFHSVTSYPSPHTC